MNKKVLTSLLVGTMIFAGIGSNVYAADRGVREVSGAILYNTSYAYVQDILKSKGYYMDGLSYIVYSSIPEMGGGARYSVKVYADNILVEDARLEVTTGNFGANFVTGTSKEELAKLSGIKWSQQINDTKYDAIYTARYEIYRNTNIDVKEEQVTSCDLGIFKFGEEYKMCYMINISLDEQNTKWQIFIDATNGSVVSSSQF